MKCACDSCSCQVEQASGFVENGRVYCAETCAHVCDKENCQCSHCKQT